MKPRLILFLLVFPSVWCNSYGQETNYDYYDIAKDSIQEIKEYTIRYDSSGQPVDTVLNYQLLYSKEGDLIEKRFSFTNNYSEYASYVFQYDKFHNLKSSKYNYPFWTKAQVYWAPPISVCKTLRPDGEPISCHYTYKNGNMKVENFSYNVADKLTKKTIYFNGKLSSVIKLDYVKFE